jgi:uncharacterized protein (DUF433 family)
MAGSVDIGTLIHRLPGVRGGRPIVRGNGRSVHGVAALHLEGLTPAEILAVAPDLTLAQVHAALASYYANREEIEADWAADAG